MGCALERHPARAEAGYRHLAVQLALGQWLSDQGLAWSLEQGLHGGGRADVHVVVGENAQTIEVQFSALPEEEWRCRDQLYRAQVGAVTWLYGDAVESLAANELVERCVALMVRAQVIATGWQVQVGTRGVGQVHWCNLEDCRMSPDGFWTPTLEAVKAATRQWRDEKEEERLHAEKEAEKARREYLAEQEARLVRAREEVQVRQRRWAERSFDRPKSVVSRAPAIAKGRMRRYEWTVADRQEVLPEAAEWTPPQGWGWLSGVPQHLQASARLLAFIVSRVDGAGPGYRLAFDDVPDPEGIVARALADAGFISFLAGDWRQRWRRCEVDL